MSAATTRRDGFTLLELLVVVMIISLLLAVLLPALESVRDSGLQAACVGNLRQIGVGIAAYSSDHEAQIPYGPTAGRYTNAGNLYPSTGAPTSLIQLQNSQPVGLGLLLKDYLAQQPRVLFCPGADPSMDPMRELDRFDKHQQAQCSYYYRHGSNTNIFDNPNLPPTPHLRLADLGTNRNGKPARAMVIDTIAITHPELKAFDIYPANNHRSRCANVLYIDGRVQNLSNDNHRLSVPLRDAGDWYKAFSNILSVFEYADEY